MTPLRCSTTAVLATVLAVAGCKTNPTVANTANDMFGAMNAPTPVAATGSPPCKRLGGNSNAENAAAGAALGATAGALIGASTTRHSSVGARNGALFGALSGAIVGSQYNALIGVSEQTDGTVKLNIPGKVLFRTGSADLNPDFQQTLNQVASTIRGYCGVTASIVGHTDATGPAAVNERLSQDRAYAVVSYLRNQSVEPDRLSAEGHASREPVASNADENGRAQNRRVEIFVRAPSN